MVAKITVPKSIEAALNYNEKKVQKGTAECLHAANYLADAKNMNFYQKLGFVFTTVGTNRVKKVPVTILKFDNDKVYLKDKLKGIDKIVISNSAYLNEQSTNIEIKSVAP